MLTLVAAALGLSACGMLGGREDAPTIALPAGAALAPDEPRASLPPEPVRPEPVVEDVQPPQSAIRQAPPEATQGGGPRGTSGETQEDAVGYALAMREAPDPQFANVTIGIAHRTQQPGTFVEVTALESGRAIIAMVVGSETFGSVAALSPGALQELGIAEHGAVRVRSVMASPQDQLALRSGRMAAPRLDAPPALLVALRRKLEATVEGIVPSRPTRRARPVPAVPVAIGSPAPRVRAVAPTSRAVPATRGGFIVQVAAVSSSQRAAELARQLGGHVAASDGIYRVQIGPFADMSGAQRARDGAVRRGYGDARIFHTE